MTSPITLCGSLSRFAVKLGAAMHEAGYRACGLDYRYVPFEIDDVAAALNAMRALSIRGYGVSMPFKLEVMPLLDRIEPLAARIGAVNTVVNDDGILVGHNTDAIGAARALEEQTSLDGARVLLLGAGGAARAVAAGLKERGAVVTICNRSDGRATLLAKEVAVASRPWSERGSLDDIDVLLNATSLGMSNVDPSSPVDAIPQRVVVMDIVYKPLDTQLLRLARDAGARTIHGGRMLLHQAARQFELYTGVDAPLEAMDSALRAEIG